MTGNASQDSKQINKACQNQINSFIYIKSNNKAVTSYSTGLTLWSNSWSGVIAHLGGFEWVVCWKMNCQEENSSLIWTVALKQHKRRLAFAFYLGKASSKLPDRWSTLSSQILTFIIWKHSEAVRNTSLFYIKVQLLSHKILTGPMIVACQWNTVENRK